MSTLYLTAAGRELWNPQKERESGRPSAQELYYNESIVGVPERQIICSTEEREEYEREKDIALDSDVLAECTFEDFHHWLTDNAELHEQGKEPSALEEIQEQEHWSSPSGCHQDCPACAAEQTDEERAEHALAERCEWNAKDIVSVLMDSAAMLQQYLASVEKGKDPDTQAVYQRAQTLLAKLKPQGITIPEPPETGAMGLPLVQAGEVLQSIAKQAVERGNITHEAMLTHLLNDLDEDAFWEKFGGPATDWIEDAVMNKV